MELISVDSAGKTAAHGVLVLSVTADLADGTGPQSLPYGWTACDPHGLGPQIDAWMDAHPDFPVADYVRPVVLPEQVTAEAQRRFMLATADARALNQVVGTPIPAAVVSLGRAIMAKGDEIAAMSPIPQDFADDARWPA